MKLKKMLAVVSALCMMCAAVPVLPVQQSSVISASAKDTEEYTEGGTYENLRYSKYANYVEIFCWIDDEITEANIPAEIDGLPVISIGDCAFQDCSGLTSVIIPESVTSIGQYAFDGCSGLTSVIIPSSVTHIRNRAFCNCSGLTSVIISHGVTSIGDSAFYNCSGLTSVTIPESVTHIEYSAFSECSSLTSIEISENNTAYTSENGVVFNKEKTILTAYPAGNTKTEYVIPDSVTSIGFGAFTRCSGLTSVTIPESVTSIEESAFSACSGLTSVIIENPDCEIYDSKYTISNGNDENYNIYFNGTIYGYENSTAQAYAEKYGYKFESLGSAPETTEPETKEISPGDADGSGKIDILDVIIINKAILGKENLSDEQLKAVDFNGDGKPDASDSLTLMKFIVGLIASLS